MIHDRVAKHGVLSDAHGVFFVSGASSALTVGSPRASIRVNLAGVTIRVSPTLYGIVLEEIDNAFDGGLYAELVQSRSFEEGVLPPGMKLVKQADGSLKMELESSRPACRRTSGRCPDHRRAPVHHLHRSLRGKQSVEAVHARASKSAAHRLRAALHGDPATPFVQHPAHPGTPQAKP